MPITAVPWLRPLSGRDRDEAHRASTPLELFFDLTFVVAVAAAAASLHHQVAEAHFSGLVNYAVVFFAIWWAWVNYSWFASAYDSGDAIFRLLTFMVMAGVLILAAGVPAAEGADHDFRVLVAGYVVMRLAMVPMWLRVARDHPEGRTVAQRYAAGIVVVQVLWVLRTLFFAHGTVGWVFFAALVILELLIPYVAEAAGNGTPWHRHHIAERYELFTIIVLGEVLLATTQAISATIESHDLSASLAQLIVGALLLVFGLWWIYFSRPMVEVVSERTAFWFGYAHYFVFGAVAAVGAFLGALVDVVQHEAHVEPRPALLLLAGAVGLFLTVLAGLHALADRRPALLLDGVAALVACCAVALVAPSAGSGVLLIGLVIVAIAAWHQTRANRDARREASRVV